MVQTMKNWAGSAYFMKNTVDRRIPLLDWAIISSEHAENLLLTAIA